VIGAIGGAFLLAPPAAGHAATTSVGFTAPAFVDTVRAGGEPGIMRSSKFGDLVYSSHEGTTHLDRNGIPSQSTVQFLCPDPTGDGCYQNHVWIWTSDDNGATWQLRNEGLSYTGFSDPDLTEDTAGTVYDTGIDLANEALFSSRDGGKTWPTGTAQCHEGDRPWLAGGVPGEVFLSTDDQVTGQHTLFHSSDYGHSCDSTGVVDAGSFGSDGGSYSGFGKGVYDRFDGSFIEPASFYDSNGTLVGVGISRLPHAADAFNGGTETFQPEEVVKTSTGVFSPFGAPQVISMDSAENIYFAWDSDDRDPNGTGGCGMTKGGPTPLPNHIWFVAGRHTGPGRWHFEKPISLAHQGNARVLWPWSVAGSPGNVSVVWYQMDQMVDPDCDMYNGQTIPDVNTFIYDAHISNALTPGLRQVTVTNASGRAIHQGGICDSGTGCVATGQDRRLGDYFTNAIDANGCVIIASGDTTVPDPVTGQPRITSLPIFLRQNSGPSLTGRDCAAPTSAVSGSGGGAGGGAGGGPPPSATPPPPQSGVATLPNTSAAAPGAPAGGALAVAAAVGALGFGARARRRGRRRESATGTTAGCRRRRGQ
jgi:hypothetical protein